IERAGAPPPANCRVLIRQPPLCNAATSECSVAVGAQVRLGEGETSAKLFSRALRAGFAGTESTGKNLFGGLAAPNRSLA
ncbi:MAG TPA: hypothetical protein VFX76_02855, partial [Roseiflexaceae bacterium]|nr:hypothetical protein [Roseiflexaceae bacterium]